MSSASILLPPLALAFWTMLILLLIRLLTLYRRLNPKINGSASFDDYTL